MNSPLKLNDLELGALDPRDVAWYQQRKACEETSSLFYPLIRQAGFARFCDVGSNYGLVGMLAARQGLEVMCVEADPRLIVPIESHFSANRLSYIALINVIAGRENTDESVFSLNPSSSLDNRVNMPNWEKVQVPTVRLADLIARYGFDQGRLFIKIDTQGFEEQVLAGLEPYLSRYRDWAIKMEFAPMWLQSQGTEPLALLQALLARFEVAEFPERIIFNTPSFEALFAYPVRMEQAAGFLNYVTALNRNDRGWVDLLVRPKQGQQVLKNG